VIETQLSQFTISGSKEAGKGRERQDLDGLPAFLTQRFQLFVAALAPLPGSPNCAKHHRLRHLRKNFPDVLTKLFFAPSRVHAGFGHSINGLEFRIKPPADALKLERGREEVKHWSQK
jgi:hypothetical protein